MKISTRYKLSTLNDFATLIGGVSAATFGGMIVNSPQVVLLGSFVVFAVWLTISFIIESFS